MVVFSIDFVKCIITTTLKDTTSLLLGQMFLNSNPVNKLSKLKKKKKNTEMRSKGLEQALI
jgi:hypothetical protein